MKPIGYKLHILLTIFISCLLLVNLLGSKLIEIFGIVTPVGLLGCPPTFLITDIVEEVQGEELPGFLYMPVSCPSVFHFFLCL